MERECIAWSIPEINGEDARLKEVVRTKSR